MDAGAFRWVLVIIAVMLVLGIYLFGQHKSRLRKRSAIETFTREEIDSAFIEDDQLRDELNNLNRILKDNEIEGDLNQIRINPARDSEKTPFVLPDPEIFLPKELEAGSESRFISYHLRHGDFRLITGEEADAAAQQAGLELDAEGLLNFCEQGEVAFQVASLTAPGHFSEIDHLDFVTLGFNCYIDLDSCENRRLAYEAMLKKIDELVRLLNVKVYKPSQELLTISDVSKIRENLV